MSDIVHILPVDDLREHEESLDCWCDPRETEEGVIVHNSVDGREDYETKRRKPH